MASSPIKPDTAEHRRLLQHKRREANWRRWGPYLAERAWGTVREDYSPDGEAWDYFTHEDARSRAYRWNEDGIGGFCDRHQHICMAVAMWNGQDDDLKERMFGLSGKEGNHGEDVKEYYYFLDATPTHSYMRMLYKYPQSAFPYEDLRETNAKLGVLDPEYDLIDTGCFDDDRYFDVQIEYAKGAPDDILMRLRITNRGADPAPLWMLPTLWFRNTWSWGYEAGPQGQTPSRPDLHAIDGLDVDLPTVRVDHPSAGIFHLYAEGADELLFTENETHNELLFGSANVSPFVKDAFHRYVCDDDNEAINPNEHGTKTAALYHFARVDPGECVELRLRLQAGEPRGRPFVDYDELFARSKQEADDFYDWVQPEPLSEEERSVQRQAFAGLLWTKQLYAYDVEQWIGGDPIYPAAPEREQGRNRHWKHLVNFDIISMPDTWEYPWYATWDLAFHCIPLALIDVEFAKRQLLLFTREWYMHPNGQLPAYEWSFDDVNPPVHAWAAWRVYKIEQREWGRCDREFLEAIFHKLLLNFTWWVNRKDAEGSNIFQGGFLGLDNIGVFDRSHDLPPGARVDQSDGTAWMAAYCLQMMKIALELARDNPVYQDTASKFLEHFLRVAHAMTDVGQPGDGLWDERDGFYYDHLLCDKNEYTTLRVRSLVGLIPLFAVDLLEPEELEAQPTFKSRMEWFVKNRPHLSGSMASLSIEGQGKRRLISLLDRDRLERVLRRMLDEKEFLSPHGIRSMSRYHHEHPFRLKLNGQIHEVGYEPAESEGVMFGGNSNWRGPVWFPINFLIIEGLQRFHHFYGDDFTIECPTGSGTYLSLDEVAQELSRRLIAIFMPDADGRRPLYGDQPIMQHDPHWRPWILFHEYFHGDNGAGLGAQHQTGWTALVAKLLQQTANRRAERYAE